MKQSDAILNLRLFMIQLQRYRSIALESYGPGSGDLRLSEETMGMMWPWVFGEKCPLPLLSKLIDRCDAGKELAPQDYYNFMYILDRFMPEVKAAVCITYPDFPEEAPSIDILTQGWDESDD